MECICIIFPKKETCAQGNVMKQRGKYHFIFPIGKFEAICLCQILNFVFQKSGFNKANLRKNRAMCLLDLNC